MKNKKRLDYTLVAEGFAEYAFIPVYIRLIAGQYNVQAVPSKLDLKKKQPSKSKVLQEAGKLCIAAIQENHDLFIAGIDLDEADHEQVKHKAECDKLASKMGNIYKLYTDKIILYVPVQAIEHWLAYQAHKIGLTNKFANDSVESKSQDELKQLLYKGNSSGPNIDRVAQTIAEKANFDELAKQSKSFAHFHNQVVTFLEQYNKT